MKPARFLPPLLAGATLILVCSNALPTVLRKRRLLKERQRLYRELVQEKRREERLRAETKALEHDPFYLRRVLFETWRARPRGAIPFPGGLVRGSEE